MHKFRFGLYLTLVLTSACTPAALRYQHLAPQASPSVMLLADTYANAGDQAAAPSGSELIALVGTDSVFGGIMLTEYDDILMLRLYIYNTSGLPYRFSPDEVILLDGNRAVLRNLAPHVAANLYASRVTTVAPYQPKYTYTASTLSSGYTSGYGNSVYYNGSSQTTVTAHEDPYHAFAHQFGAAITRGQNEKYASMANSVYATGIGEGWEVPSNASNIGALYWANRPNLAMPLIVRFVGTGYEVVFTRAK